jgi:hypothetical protein
LSPGLAPQREGYYNANVGLNLDRGGSNPSVSFNLAISRVKTLNDVYAQLKPEVDKLGDELKKAAESFRTTVALESRMPISMPGPPSMHFTTAAGASLPGDMSDC